MNKHPGGGKPNAPRCSAAGPPAPDVHSVRCMESRPWGFMDWCAARYGDVFTLRFPRQRPWVVVSHPDAVKEVFSGPPELLRAAESDRIMQPVVGRTPCCCSRGRAQGAASTPSAVVPRQRPAVLCRHDDRRRPSGDRTLAAR